MAVKAEVVAGALLAPLGVAKEVTKKYQ